MIRKFWSWCALATTPRVSLAFGGQLTHRLSNPSGSSTSLLFSSMYSTDSESFRPKRGDKIQVEVISFGPLGASVVVVGKGHEQSNLIAADDEPLGSGLISQKEISYFREKRNGVDVVRGEILPAYVEDIRDDSKLKIGLRTFGGKAKSAEVGDLILQLLESTPKGILSVGDKSSPEEISKIFPGVSKASFKKAIGNLYRKGLVQPGPNSISILDSTKHNE